MYDSSVLLHRAVSTIQFLPTTYVEAFETYVRGIAPTQSSAQAQFHSSLMAIQSTIQAMLTSLSRPGTIISRIQEARREADRNSGSTSRSSRWPLGLLDDTRQRQQEEREGRARKSREEATYLSRELRYTQQTVASELAGWHSIHEKMGRRVIRDLARGMIVQERMKLSGLARALRKIREGTGSTGAARSSPTTQDTMAGLAATEEAIHN